MPGNVLARVLRQAKARIVARGIAVFSIVSGNVVFRISKVDKAALVASEIELSVVEIR